MFTPGSYLTPQVAFPCWSPLCVKLFPNSAERSLESDNSPHIPEKTNYCFLLLSGVCGEKLRFSSRSGRTPVRCFSLCFVLIISSPAPFLLPSAIHAIPSLPTRRYPTVGLASKLSAVCVRSGSKLLKLYHPLKTRTFPLTRGLM